MLLAADSHVSSMHINSKQWNINFIKHVSILSAIFDIHQPPLPWLRIPGAAHPFLHISAWRGDKWSARENLQLL